MELELKAKEYKRLCKKLERIKENIKDANNKNLLEIKENFIKNQEEIIEINRQLKELK